MDTILKILLPIYLILFFSIVFIWRTYYVWKQTGVNPFKFRNADNAQSTIGKAMSFTWVLCIIIVSIHSISDQVYSFLIPINWLEISLLSIIGLVILTISLGWVIIAQSQMGNAWRIGIDSEHPSGLVQTGIFARSRNPIFLGMIAMLLGLLITLPNALSLLSFGIGFVLLQIQVRQKGDFFLKTYGAMYQEYTQHVPRWF